MVPKLDLSRLGKFQVGNEKEEKSKSEYSYKVRPTCLPLIVCGSHIGAVLCVDIIFVGCASRDRLMRLA